MSLADNLRRVQERMDQACAQAGRAPADVTLVAVSKTFPAKAVVEAGRLGLRCFGENRVGEAAEKIPTVNSQLTIENIQLPIEWHLIGHLQSRKAREAAGLVDVIQSVDSFTLADKLSRVCVEAGRVLPILLECNVSGEESKYGFPAATAAERERFPAEVERIIALPGVRVEGLMTVAPIAADAEEVRPVFRALRQLRDDVADRFPQASWQHLSMGMTDDFVAAIQEGATIVRIGRAIFGERTPA